MFKKILFGWQGIDRRQDETVTVLDTDQTITENKRKTDCKRTTVPIHTIQEYCIKTTLGCGGFGITYLATDTLLGGHVAIKEYFPSGLVNRDKNSRLVVEPDSEEIFQWGLSRFLQEAKILNKFNHFNIVRVRRLFKENNTAYIVMDYEEGETLDSLIKKQHDLADEDGIKGFIVQIFDGLQVIHRKGFIHRDIKPQNILIRRDCSPILIDFGSARQDLEEKCHQHTTVVSHGYSPIEQYGGDGDGQGPWTDLYALGATLYKAMTGSAPTKAILRMNAIMQGKKDPYVAVSEQVDGKYSSAFCASLDRSLSLASKDRYQSISEWSRDLFGENHSNSTLIIGQKVSCNYLVSDSNKLIFGLSWCDADQSNDLDASAFIIGKDGKIKKDRDFIFYNNLKSICGGVLHSGDSVSCGNSGDDEQIIIEMSRLADHAKRIVFSVSIHDEEGHSTFCKLEEVRIRLIHEKSEQQIFKYIIPPSHELNNNRSIIIGELYRHQKKEWIFEPKKDFYSGGLEFIARKFGVDIC